MIGLLEILGTLGPIADLGVTGCLMILVWRLMVKKDKKSYEMIETQNEERREMYRSMEELVKEVTIALTYKNTTDEKMANAVDKLAEQLRGLKDALKEKNNETS